MRRIGFPTHLQTRTLRLIEELGYTTSRPSELSTAIKRLSDFYIQNPMGATPWHERWAQAAYLSYYLPLNYARVSAVAREAVRSGFFSGLKSMIDFGSGPGTAQMAIMELTSEFESALCVDRIREPLELHKKLAGEDSRLRWRTDLPSTVLPVRNSRLAVFSYALTEIERLPAWAIESEAILFIEPSTRQDGRKLLERRKELLADGYYAYAPCTHQNMCPLFENSEKDWCHDRIEWDPPPGWDAIESGLPMKNRTLTFSYLLVRKTPPAQTTALRARMVSDPLVEKGKTRQLVCRGPAREFLSWFPQRLEQVPNLDRGDLVELGSDLEVRSNELRVRAPESQVRVLK